MVYLELRANTARLDKTNFFKYSDLLASCFRRDVHCVSANCTVTVSAKNLIYQLYAFKAFTFETYLPYICFLRVAKAMVAATTWTNIDENNAHRNT